MPVVPTSSNFYQYKSLKGVQRVINVVDAAQDPLELSKFKLSKAIRGPPSPPVPIQHSPPRKLSVSDQAAWKIPPCISNWKNPKGYTIPLDKRLAADGRGLQEVTMNDRFATLSESMYAAEQRAREEVELRQQHIKSLHTKEQRAREQELREIARQAMEERAVKQAAVQQETAEEREQRLGREKLRAERKYEYERDQKLAKNKKPERERDVTERIALGQAAPLVQNLQQYDSRLAGQNKGSLSSGFNDDEEDNEYDTEMFKGRAPLYRPDKDRIAQEQGRQEKTQQVKVQFEKDEDDPFGLAGILGNKKAASSAADGAKDAKRKKV